MSQAIPTQTSAGAVVIDANVLVAICSKEPGEVTAKAALSHYTAKNWAFYAPGAILTEVLFILCRKLHEGVIDATKHKKAVEEFNDYMNWLQVSRFTKLSKIDECEGDQLESAMTFLLGLKT